MYCYYINVLWLFLTVPWVGLQCVIVVFSDHTHLLFEGVRLFLLTLFVPVNNTSVMSALSGHLFPGLNQF